MHIQPTFSETILTSKVGQTDLVLDMRSGIISRFVLTRLQIAVHTEFGLQLCRVSTAPGNTGNLKFNWSSWKIAKSLRQSWDSCSPSKLVGWHSDERWSELIITCSVRDSSYIACCRNIINQAVTT